MRIGGLGMATWQDEFIRLSELHRHEVEKWLEGTHNVKVMSAIMDKVGGTIKLRDLVEKTLKCRIKPRWD